MDFFFSKIYWYCYITEKENINNDDIDDDDDKWKNNKINHNNHIREIFDQEDNNRCNENSIIIKIFEYNDKYDVTIPKCCQKKSKRI